MTDKQTLKWWIDRARQLEDKLREVQEYSSKRDERIVTAVLERNTGYSHARHWQEIAGAFASACLLDGFGHVKEVDMHVLSIAYNAYQQATSNDD